MEETTKPQVQQAAYTTTNATESLNKITEELREQNKTLIEAVAKGFANNK